MSRKRAGWQMERPIPCRSCQQKPANQDLFFSSPGGVKTAAMLCEGCYSRGLPSRRREPLERERDELEAFADMAHERDHRWGAGHGPSPYAGPEVSPFPESDQ